MRPCALAPPPASGPQPRPPLCSSRTAPPRMPHLSSQTCSAPPTAALPAPMPRCPGTRLRPPHFPPRARVLPASCLRATLRPAPPHPHPQPSRLDCAIILTFELSSPLFFPNPHLSSLSCLPSAILLLPAPAGRGICSPVFSAAAACMHASRRLSLPTHPPFCARKPHAFLLNGGMLQISCKATNKTHAQVAQRGGGGAQAGFVHIREKHGHRRAWGGVGAGRLA